ncbi:von Willebrand factor A domain-containing protein 2-like [Physella acuta]|uniref:von Willebrand factor A domain-containing protein 2-like n=1 Tax=Physella acuta TaxID=109671 RepID=UPI0027DCED16|nr:von Willebrand factor A domain-containing protein 2-like [Physella acuta]
MASETTVLRYNPLIFENETASNDNSSRIACSAAVDIVFLIESSEHVKGRENFTQMLWFASNISHSFLISPDYVLVAGVVFSDVASKMFDLKDHRDKDNVQSALLNSPYMERESRTDEALSLVEQGEMFGL